jgi:hypothetical protein
MLFVTEPNRIKVLAGENPRTHDVRRRRDAATQAISIGAGTLLAIEIDVETAASWMMPTAWRPSASSTSTSPRRPSSPPSSAP